MLRVFLLIFVTIIMYRCSSSGLTDSKGKPGGATETIGIIFDSLGIPVEGAKVFFVPENYTPNNVIQNDIDCTHTNEHGEFDYSMLVDGNYNFMYEKSGLHGRTEAVLVKDGATDNVISDTLEIPGGIIGIATLLPQHDNREIYVLIIGSNRFTIADSLGNFEINSLAKGNYNLKFLTSENNYGVIDTSVEVMAKEVSIITDTVKIPYIGLPIPENITAFYDTLEQKVSLYWDAVSSNKLSGYNIYRKSVMDSTYSLISSKPINEPFFIDSSDGINILQGNTYQYKISSINIDGQSGEYSKVLPVIISTAFMSGNNHKLYHSKEITSGGLSIALDGKLHAIIADTNRLFNINNELCEIQGSDELSFNATPYDMTIMDDSTFLIATDKGIYNIDNNGKVLYWYNVKTTHIESHLSRFIYYSTNNKFFSSINTIIKLDTYTGIEDTLFVDENRTIASFIIDNGSPITLYNTRGEISIEKWNNKESMKIATWKSNSKYENGDIALNGESVSILASNEIRTIMKKSGKLIARTFINSKAIKIACHSNNQIFVLHEDGIIKELKR